MPMLGVPGPGTLPLPGAAGGWQEIARQAQVELADVLATAIAGGGLDRGYGPWLALDSALSRTGALALERLADWHGGHPTLRATAQSWAHDLREDALAAAADLRASGVTGSLPLAPVVAQWHGYVSAACASPRAGEALGTVLLHGVLLHGAVRPIATEAMALPLAGAGRAWLGRRLRNQPGLTPGVGRADLCAAWPASALAAGARRAWEWYRVALAAIPGFGHE